jgi:hypothetical protein
MADVRIGGTDLFSLRVNTIQGMLAPLKGGRRVACDLVKDKQRGGKVFAAHDGHALSGDFRDWAFRTFAPDIWCRYFELWRPLAAGRDQWHLFCAYLTLAKTDRVRQCLVEVACVHCDPTDNSTEPIGSYKRGPHLHVELADDPLPRAHFPLNLGHLKEVLASPANVTKALTDAVAVVSHEVVARYRNRRV